MEDILAVTRNACFKGRDPVGIKTGVRVLCVWKSYQHGFLLSLASLNWVEISSELPVIPTITLGNPERVWRLADYY